LAGHSNATVLYNFSAFSVISCKPQFPSYISALLPQDQIFEPEPDFQFESTPVKKKKEQQTEETEEGKPLEKNVYIIKSFFNI